MGVMFSHCHSREHSNRHSREHSNRHSCEHSNRLSREHSIRHSCESRNPERRRSRIGQICICEIVSLLGSVDIPIRQLRHSCGACPCESREQESSRFQMAQMSRNRLHLRLWIPGPDLQYQHARYFTAHYQVIPTEPPATPRLLHAEYRARHRHPPTAVPLPAAPTRNRPYR